MKQLIALGALLLSACAVAPTALVAAPAQAAASVGPVTRTLATCEPALVIPPGILARARAQFEGRPSAPPPPISEADLSDYRKMQTEQQSRDWGNLCRFRAENIALMQVKADAGRVVFMGDSITQNWAFSEPLFFTGPLINRGISGQTSPQMLLRFRSDVIALQPAAVHILGGVNDIAGNTGPSTLEDIEANIASMVELAKAHGVGVILATVLPAATFNWAPQLRPSAQILAINDWIRVYAKEQNLILADYYPALATPTGAMSPELSLDGVHPNKAGYAVMAPITRAALDKALGR